MKLPLLFCCGLALVGAGGWAVAAPKEAASAASANASASGGEDIIPKALSTDHFNKLARQSPFTVPTAPVTAPPAPKAAPWSSKLSVQGVGQDGNRLMATVLDKDTNERFQVRTDDPQNANSHGIGLASVQWSDKPSDIKVTLSRGTEFAAVPIDPGILTAPTGPAPAPGMPVGAAGFGGNRPAPGMMGPNRMVNPNLSVPAQPPNLQRRVAPIRATPPQIPGDGAQRQGLVTPKAVNSRPARGVATSADDDDDDD